MRPAGALAGRVAGRASAEAPGVPALGRLAWSEADGLPGLVVDRYASVLVVQCGTLGMARRRREIEAALGRVVGELPVFNKDEDGPAKLEGFEPAHGWAGRPGPATVEVDEAGVGFTLALGVGHKTGLDLVVLDPPPFARSRTQLEAAVRGYKEINLRAMRLLERGGSLLTFSCSHHVSQARFEELCRDAAADAGARLQMVAPLTQASDHPVVLTIPETRYLSGLLLQAM